MKEGARTVIVTGGAQGIGLGMTEFFLEKGWNVACLDIDEEAGKELCRRYHDSKALSFHLGDVGVEEDVRKCVARLTSRFGGIDALINNAGISSPGRTPITELSLEQWEKMLTTNLTGAFLMAKHTVPFLRQRQGAIINIASTRALQSEANTESYSASKGGLVALTHSLAVSLGPEVRVNCILPGWIDVSGMKKSSKRYDPQISREDHLQHPVGRIGVVEDISNMANFLISKEAGFITGQNFVVDGGMTRKMIYVE